MKRPAYILPLTLVLATAPIGSLHAQEAGEDAGTLMERGAEMFLEGLMQGMEPALDDLRGMAEEMQPAFRQFMQEMGPAFAGILDQIDDLTNYHPPEILPNGDIILRRKTPLESQEEAPLPEGGIEL
jgi:hypothetical protein